MKYKTILLEVKLWITPTLTFVSIFSSANKIIQKNSFYEKS
jgi:hypothetical protein